MLRRQRFAVVPVGTLTPHPRNARRGDLESIEQSIAVNGFFGSVLVQEGTGLILVGNHRYRAGVARGLTEIPALFVECSDAEAERIALADNRTSDLGTWDTEKLVAQLESVLAETGSIAGTGFSPEHMAAMQAELAELAANAVANLEAQDDAGEGEASDEDDLDTLHVPSEPITKPGDLWLLGDHRLLCGDTFNAADRKILFAGERMDLIVTDPPFAIYGSSTGIGADIADDGMVRPYFVDLFRIMFATVREFAHIYVCCDWRSWASIWEGAKAANVSPKNCIVWDKLSSGLGSSYANTYELVGFFARLPPATAMKSTTRRGQRTVLKPNLMKFPRVSGAEREHNAAKPVGLFCELIQNSSDPGERVADFYAGSGTTIIAAEKTKRRAYSIEQKPKYCDVVVARWERLTGSRAKRVPAEDLATARKSKAPKAAEEKPQTELDDTPPVA